MPSQEDEHREKYEAIAQWLGVNALCGLVPFTRAQIRDALEAGDEHLNTLPLSAWDKVHGAAEPDKVCSCCGRTVAGHEPFGVLALVRRARGAVPGRAGRQWSLSDSVCVLKHVARHHMVR